MSSLELPWFATTEDLFAISVMILSHGTSCPQVFHWTQLCIFYSKCIAFSILFKFFNYSTSRNMVWCLSKSTYTCVQSKVYIHEKKKLHKSTSMCIITTYKYIKYIPNTSYKFKLQKSTLYNSNTNVKLVLGTNKNFHDLVRDYSNRWSHLKYLEHTY